jgi:hypothetical protein
VGPKKHRTHHPCRCRRLHRLRDCGRGYRELLSLLAPGVGTPPLYYFVTDLISQCIYIAAAGYLCRVIARPSQKTALFALIALGVLVGLVSLVTSWKSEPHWYGIALFVTYPPCVWIGWTLKDRENRQSAADL